MYYTGRNTNELSIFFTSFEEIIPILSLVIGGFIAFYFDRKKNREYALHENKRKIYGEFIEIIIDLFGKNKSFKIVGIQKKDDFTYLTLIENK